MTNTTNQKNSDRGNLDTIKEMILRNSHPKHFGKSYKSACVFLLFSEREELYFTAILKADNKDYSWANQVALPGGHIDDEDESPVAAAYRELEEELNISRHHVEFIGSMGHFLTINNTEIEVFTGVWNEKETIHYDTKEIARVFSVPLSKIVKTHFEKKMNGRLPDWDELLYPVEDLVIWGVTAKILHYFIELVYS